MAIFVTGFLPFRGDKINPSHFAAEYASSLGVEAEVFPVCYDKVDEAFSRLPLDGRRFLLFGLAAKRTDVSLERFAYNQTDKTLLDESGNAPSREQALGEAETRRETRFDLVRLGEKLGKAGVKNHVSLDPGRYLCNYAYYQALALSDGQALFVHLPPLSEGFDEEKLRQTVRVLLEELR